MLPLTPEDRVLINKFKHVNDDEKYKIICSNTVEANIRIATHHAEFRLFCQRSELDDFWRKHWAAYGPILCVQQGLASCLFYPYPHQTHFDLVRGAYFYYQSQLIATSVDTLFPEEEIACLCTAINFGSVHAIQRYNQYCYHNLQAALSPEDEKKLYLTVIENSKKMLPNDGAYGYMVLGESLGNYALWLVKNALPGKANYFMSAAETAYQHATIILQESQYSIHNASLGQGLATSNAARMVDPNQAKTLLREQFEAITHSNTSHNNPFSL